MLVRLLGDADTNTQGVGHGISGTDKPDLYQSERWGQFSYAIPVPNGAYTLRLHFAEIYAPANMPGMRVFDVAAEGNTILSNFDIVAEAGQYAAVVKEFAVTVSDGKMDVAFSSQDSAKVSALEVIPLDPSQLWPRRT